MVALAYLNTETNLPNWVPFHDEQPRGLAYETDTHFVHFYGRDAGFWVVSPGLTVTEAKSGTLRDWVIRTFGAKDIVALHNKPGTAIKSIWRPGLYYDSQILEALESTSYEVQLAEQALLMLIHKFDEILNYIEPSVGSLSTYGHKSRELLILACTEVENHWTTLLKMAGIKPSKRGFSTKDYVRLLRPAFLKEYKIDFPRYAVLNSCAPFESWDESQPTQSLLWYDAYNKTKHDRSSNFSYATLANCLSAIAANLVLFAVRFGPNRLFRGGGSLPTFVNQLFSLELVNCDPASFYVPKIKLPNNQLNSLVCFNSQKITEKWISQQIVI
jgi:hypothetical protein